MKSSDIHIRAISQDKPQQTITKIHLKFTYSKFHSNFPGAKWVNLANINTFWSYDQEVMETLFALCGGNPPVSSGCLTKGHWCNAHVMTHINASRLHLMQFEASLQCRVALFFYSLKWESICFIDCCMCHRNVVRFFVCTCILHINNFFIMNVQFIWL